MKKITFKKIGQKNLILFALCLTLSLLVSTALSPKLAFAQSITAFGSDEEESSSPKMGLKFRRVEPSAEDQDNTNEGDASESSQNGIASALSSLNNQDTEEFQKKQLELQEKIRQKERDMAAKQAKQTLFPLRPEEIENMLELFSVTREKAETGGRVVPKPQVVVSDVSLDPSAIPQIIRTAPGHVTTLTILDVSGQPWPIQDVTWAGEFEVIPPEQGGHIIRITPLTAHGFGNMSIRLIDLATPVTFSLETSPYISYYRFDARMPEYGPNGAISLISQGPGMQSGDGLMTALLNGAPPDKAVRLSVDGVDGRTSVWRAEGRVFVRTPLSLLSPGWTASASSADGMKIFQIKESPVLLLSDQGNMVRARIGKEEIVDDGE